MKFLPILALIALSVFPTSKADNLEIPFFDTMLGNQYTKGERLLDYRLGDDSAPVMMEAGLDWFGGVLSQSDPYFSPDVHRSVVEDLRTTLSANLTATLKVELMHMVQLEL